MFINRLLVESLRNLQNTALDEFSQINLFVGDNGSGKTSLLEAISIASLGRSFRHHKIQTVIHQKQSALSVFVQCQNDNSEQHKLGIQRDRKNKYIIRIDGENAKSLAQLSYQLPVVVLDANAFLLLDGSSTQRRQFIDWGVFHVKHSFYDHWRQLQRILKQRNSLLRKGITDYGQYRPWDNELIEHSLAIEELRLEYLKNFETVFNQILPQLDASLSKQKVFYKSGWLSEKIDFDSIHSASSFDKGELESQLRESFEKDCKYQRTHIGAHRADLQVRINQNDVRDIYSRGQKKTIVAAMKLSQARIVSRETLKKPVLLLDDLPSELDQNHLKDFLSHVLQEGYQCFITAVDREQFRDIPLEKTHMFHVERGKISPMIAQGEAQE